MVQGTDHGKMENQKSISKTSMKVTIYGSPMSRITIYGTLMLESGKGMEVRNWKVLDSS